MSKIFRIGDEIKAGKLSNGFRRIDLSPFRRAPSHNINDLVQERIINEAINFTYLNRKTALPSEINRDGLYLLLLCGLWGKTNVKLDLNLDSWEGKKEAAFFTSEENLKAIDLICSGTSLEPKNSTVYWEGFQKDNNYWPLFKPQIDDSSDPIEGLYINPSGTFTLKYKNREILDRFSLLNSAVLFGLFYDINKLDIK